MIAAAIAAGLVYANLPSPILADTGAMVLPTDPAPLVADTKAGKRSFTVEVADVASERERGLMFRQKMDDGRGMLFVFQATQPVGLLDEEHGAAARSRLCRPGWNSARGRTRRTDVGGDHSPPEPVRFVLELNAGIAEKAGIESGVRLHHPAIDKVSGDSDNRRTENAL